jgi:4-alpha-glucanotransferase
MHVEPITLSNVKLNSYKLVANRNQTHNVQDKLDSFELRGQHYDTIPFTGINAKGIVKQRGILMHITSLPAHRSYCGQFGDPQTEQFIKWMIASKQTHWIMNPLNALEDNLCPYSSVGRFSRNKFIVNLNHLTEQRYGKILKPTELPDDITAPEFTLEMLEQQKNPRFRIAFNRFKKLPQTAPIKQEYNRFIAENDRLWLDDYANYDMLSKRYGKDWTQWKKSLQTAPEDARRENISLKDKLYYLIRKDDSGITSEQISDEVELFKFEQFLYDEQFNEMTESLNKRGINLIMDLPIGVSPTGVDTWGKKNIFLLDSNFHPTKVSGCPPEPNYPYTQVWDHALYNYDSAEFWDYNEKSLRKLLKNSDLRLDHFVGYINRAAIPTSYVKEDGTVINGTKNIFKPKEEGGMGIDFFCKDWIENVYTKTSPTGETIFDVFVRVARELGKKPEDTYILENFGPLSKTKAYKAFDKKHGKDFISQRVPIGVGMGNKGSGKSKPNSPFVMKDSNIALLTGNHDLPSLRETIDVLMNVEGKKQTKQQKRASDLFMRFCKDELGLTADEIKNKEEVYINTMKWFYTQNVKQVQTTLQDALGIYWRPNIPGFWNGMEDKYLQRPTPEALLSYWCKVFPKDFLSRENKSGINPGYRSLADKFVATMQDLFS